MRETAPESLPIMHLLSISMQNIRSIRQLDWAVPAGQESRGWHVIIGDNGAGKSAFLRAVALTLAGRENAEALRQDWNLWLRHEQREGGVRLECDFDEDDRWAGKGKPLKNYLARVDLKFRRTGPKVELIYPKVSPSPERHVWSGKRGWFSASFGPFRRFSGGDKDAEKLFYSHPLLARHLSVFGENVALSECVEWLQKLRFKQLERQPEGDLLAQLPQFVNQPGFLPDGVRLDEVSSEGVRFVDANGVPLAVTTLSDGFRSVLSFTFELLRQLALTYGSDGLFSQDGNQSVVNRSGVVLVDEIDAHLHPTWQRRIGFWLTEHFPKLQFIVTSHSPLVCQAAEHGSIFRLASPGTEEESAMATGIERERLIFGSVVEAYGTDYFGKNISRSRSSKLKQERLAALNQRALFGKLSAPEKRERKALQALFPAVL
jgi:hypothetical protein